MYFDVLQPPTREQRALLVIMPPPDAGGSEALEKITIGIFNNLNYD